LYLQKNGGIKGMAKLTTHVLDTSNGVPATGIEIRLNIVQDGGSTLIKRSKTNSDGRCDEALLEGQDFLSGTYELVFDVEKYFNNMGVDCHFLKDVVIRFHVGNNNENYHVPLLVSPFSYSTYRGS
jgi:5-hydroxyisourate hydrolase